MIKMIVFDMAGTTVDEDNVVYKTLRKVINDAGYDFTLDHVLAIGAGKEKLQAIKDILKTDPRFTAPDFADQLYAIFDKELTTAYEDLDVQPQPGAGELFKSLKEKNIRVVLNTGYNKTVAGSLLRKLNWAVGSEIDALVTASDVSNNRPKPDMIYLAMKEFAISHAKEVAKVGDSIIDIEEGQNAGCGLSIGITTGAHTEAQLQSAHPDYIIHNLMDIIPILN